MLAHRLRPGLVVGHRQLHNSAVRLNRALFDPKEVERVTDDVDVCIVGGGPAGLSAAIRLKQLEKENGKEVRVVVLEKGPEVGSHILSGAVIEPRALDELLPDWKTMDGHPLTRPTTSSRMRFLTSRSSFPMPHPPQMSNKGNYILSLSRFTAWLGSIAEEMGVEVYPGFAGAGVAYSEDKKAVQGVITNEIGLDKESRMKDSFEPGMQFNAKVTLLAEGAHGSLSKSVMKEFDLRKGVDPQTYGLGLKEVWRIAEDKRRPGEVIHTMGWPLDSQTYGGAFLYHMDDGLVTLGIVVGLDYANPYISPYREFQRMKHHPYYADILTGGERLAYGARVINEGGLQSIPKLHFPGGALIGCSAGFVNVPKIKGTHNAMKSGMLAAEAAYEAITSDAAEAGPVDLSKYEESVKNSWIWKELKEVRNLRPSFNSPLGLWGGMAYSGLDSLFLKGRTPWTFRTKISDAAHTKPASRFKPIKYPPPQAPLSTDILTSVSLTATNHAEDQPVHLRLPPGEEARVAHVKKNVGEFAGLLGRGCPAAVYEYVDSEPGESGSFEGKKLVINSQNCIHCKFCDIKVPTQDITWTVPEGGGGPKYSLPSLYADNFAMASLIAILDLKGKPLIQRSYRDDVPLSYVERFLPLILDFEEEGTTVTPCFSSQGINYMHIRHSNLYLLAMSKRNSNAAEIILFLHRLVSVLVEYFKELEEESIRDNFVIIYELLDEMMDFGYPQTTESKILQEYITQESHKLEVQARPPVAVTNAVSWRSEGIRYRKNEVFLDVVESVNMLVNANGNVIRSEILGAVKMKCYLSGMPELRLGLNDKAMFESTGRSSRGKAIEMEDVKFHQCVRLSRFENDRTISFIPPDGEFELMSYRLSTPVKPLIWVEAAVESHRGSRIEFMVKVKGQFKRRSTANNVEIYVPVPDDADTPRFRASTGSVQYAPDKSAFVWKIKQLGGAREFLMRAHFGLPSVRNAEESEKRAPITVKFEIPYFTVSGIQVRYLKIVEKSGYQALPWVRYITQHGDDYSLRTALEKGSGPIVPI